MTGAADLSHLIPVPVPSDRAWFDPALVYRNLYTTVTPVTSPAAGSFLAAKGNPFRFAVGFTRGPNNFPTMYVGPYTNVASWNGWNVPASSWVWFNIQTYGSVVGDQWWVATGSPCDLVVIEVIRK